MRKESIRMLTLQCLCYPEWCLMLLSLVRRTLYWHFFVPPPCQKFWNTNNAIEIPSFWACRKHFVADFGHSWNYVNAGTVVLAEGPHYPSCPSPEGRKQRATVVWVSRGKLLFCCTENWMDRPPKSISSMSFWRNPRSRSPENTHLPCGLEVTIVKRIELMFRRVLFEQANCWIIGKTHLS